MKAFFSFLLFGAVVAFVHSTATKEVSEKFRAAVATCTKRHNLDKLKVEEYFKLAKLPETQEEKCAVLCYFEEMEYVKDGKFDDEKVFSSNKLKWDDEAVVAKANEVYKTCVKEHMLPDVKLDCECAAKMGVCLKTEGEKQSVPLPELYKEQ